MFLRFKIMKILRTCGVSLLYIAVLQTPSVAGGDSWAVRIAEMHQKSASQAIVVLQPLEDKSFNRHCDQLLIEIDYQPNYLRDLIELAPGRAYAAFNSHQEALISLQRDYQQQSRTRFGELVGGLVPKQAQQAHRSWLDAGLHFISKLFNRKDTPSITSNVPSHCQFVAQGLGLFTEASEQQVVYVLNEL